MNAGATLECGRFPVHPPATKPLAIVHPVIMADAEASLRVLSRYWVGTVYTRDHSPTGFSQVVCTNRTGFLGVGRG